MFSSPRPTDRTYLPASTPPPRISLSLSHSLSVCYTRPRQRVFEHRSRDGDDDDEEEKKLTTSAADKENAFLHRGGHASRTHIQGTCACVQRVCIDSREIFRSPNRPRSFEVRSAALSRETRSWFLLVALPARYRYLKWSALEIWWKKGGKVRKIAKEHDEGRTLAATRAARSNG